ncbi:hypothetical protein [Providencia sp. PROV174]|uniref:hypothetical protein n=1 Tax=Providencia sp. PROV174 TaxID=2949877 RepID=UPI00234B677E|nr:hypothetical protein [Providencia sp. PROV174]
MVSKLSRYIEAGENGKIHIKLEDTLRVMDEIVAKYSGTSVINEVDGGTKELKELRKEFDLSRERIETLKKNDEEFFLNS